MKKYLLTMSICCACVIGVAQAMLELEKPVGGVSDTFCKRVEKPCVSYSYEVQHETVAINKP